MFLSIGEEEPIFILRAQDKLSEAAMAMYQALAESERIHARRHLSYLKGIRTTAENLHQALEGEAGEFEIMYPRMLKEAEEEKKEGPKISFKQAGEVEKVHHELFKKAADDPEAFPVMDYFICNACGYIAVEDLPDKCPVCGAVRKAFYQVLSVKSR